MKLINRLLLPLLLVSSVSSCNAQSRQTSDKQPSYKIWDELLHKYVNEKGLVNYGGFIHDSTKLDEFLRQLGEHAPDPRKWKVNERKAFWINAYNAFTVKLITLHYPVKSIKDIGPRIQVTFVNTPWEIKFFSVGGEKMDLDEIEHKILRKKFDDPRIHFALVCAARSCPPLRNEAYTPEKLDEQLNDQGRKFLGDNFKNRITPDRLQLSMYFKWYKGDFTKHQSLITFLNSFAPVKIYPDASVSYINYDWDLNKQ